jgi:hypothetical protein
MLPVSRWFARSFQTNYKFVMRINYFVPVVLRATSQRFLYLQFVCSASGNIFVRLVLCTFKETERTNEQPERNASLLQLIHCLSSFGDG